jgi:hypothetical protein
LAHHRLEKPVGTAEAACRATRSVRDGDPGDVDVVGVAEVVDGFGGAVTVERVVAVALEEIARAVEREEAGEERFDRASSAFTN